MNKSPLVRRLYIALGVTLFLVVFAYLTVTVMVPNVVGSGQKAAQGTAVSQLRTLLWTEDRLHELKAADRDGDGQGEYGFLAQLSHSAPLKGLIPLNIPLLEGPLGKVIPGQHGGISNYAAYCFAIFLPAKGGGGATELPTGGEEPGQVDPDGAEQYWVAYAWPIQRSMAGTKVFYINQDEEIWESDGLGKGQGYEGTRNVPAFNAALPRPDLSIIPNVHLPGGDGGMWKPWKNKKPRAPR